MFEPKIVGFFCNWCTYLAADMAGSARITYAPNLRVVRVMCSGRVDPQMVLWAFAQGADGVLIGGCHPGDCHYIEGNHKALRRATLLKRMLPQLGVEGDRFRLEWISGSEAEKLVSVTNDFVARLKELGPRGGQPQPAAAHGDEPKTQPTAVAHGHEPKTQPAAVAHGHEPKTQPTAVAQGDQERTELAAVAHGHEPKTQPTAVAQGDQERTELAAVAQGEEEKPEPREQPPDPAPTVAEEEGLRQSPTIPAGPPTVVTKAVVTKAEG